MYYQYMSSSMVLLRWMTLYVICFGSVLSIKSTLVVSYIREQDS